MSKRVAGILAGLAVVWVGACYDFGQFQFGEAPEVASGSATVTGGGAGGIGGATPASASTGTPQCMMDSDCPGMDTDCRTPRCANGACFEQYEGQGTLCNDMGGVVCNNTGDCVLRPNGDTCVGTGGAGGAGGAGGVGGAGGGGMSECQSGFCVDGVCCNTACGSTCQACDLTGNVGTCTPIPMGLDPDGECTMTAQSTCGANGMGCSGANACVLWPNNTMCSAPMCMAGVASTQGLCNGMGTCQTTTTMCTPYVCGATTCLLDCMMNGDADCVTTHYCVGNMCVPKLAQGTACTGDSQCQTGFCRDGFCCNTACTATCMSCAAAHTMGMNGTCANVTMGTDPKNQCGLNCCNGMGMCDMSGMCP